MKKRHGKNKLRKPPKFVITPEELLEGWEVSRLSALEWTFVERIVITGNIPMSFVLFASGPYIYIHDELAGTISKENFVFASQLCVFPGTGTYVRGVANLHNGYIMAWGDIYIAHISVMNLIDGGAVCRSNILSTGLLITAAKSYRNSGSEVPVVEVCFANGTVQTISFPVKQPTASLRIYKPKRVPLKPAEMITAANTTQPQIYLGTSQGRLLVMEGTILFFATDPLLNCPVRQIVAWPGLDYGSFFTILLIFENGSIVSWKSKKQMTEIKGRFTCLIDAPVKLANNFIYTVAGDRDGNLTMLCVEPGKIEPFRTFRAVTKSRITVLDLINNHDVFIGTDMGEFQWLDLSLVTNNKPMSVSIDSRNCYKYYFLKDDKLRKTFETYFERKNLKMKYFCCTGTEIIAAYSRNFFAHITVNEATAIEGLMAIPRNNNIVQVILMQSYILLQQSDGTVNVYRISSKDRPFIPALQTKITGRITAAACLEHGNKRRGLPQKIDVIFSYLDGKTEVFIGELKKTGMTIRDPYSLSSTGSSYIVSSISSPQHLGSTTFLLLSNKGKLETAVKTSVLRTAELAYARVPDHDLRSIIGRGHSLMEMSFGIVAAGFKQHTLHACWISVDEYSTYQFAHLFTVDTRSSRLPFTIIETKLPLAGGDSQKGNELIVAYSHKDGFLKEDRFPFSKPTILNRVNHSGIITCQDMVRFDRDRVCAYTGDTNGNFCIWSFCPDSVADNQKLLECKLNGAVKVIYQLDHHIVVVTSQGDLHIFRAIGDPWIRMLTRPPYKLGGTVAYALEGITCNFFDMKMLNMTPKQLEAAKAFDRSLFVVLEDGTFMKVHLLEELDENGERKITTTVFAKIRIATKMAHCLYIGNNPYIFLLGTDNILTRVSLSDTGEATARMNWPISMMKIFSMDPVSIVLIGDQQGWIYFITYYAEKIKSIHIDRYHQHAIIDIAVTADENMCMSIVSLDISGILVVRKVSNGKPTEPPFIWASPVPSPRKIAVYGERQILVLGKGAATVTF